MNISKEKLDSLLTEQRNPRSMNIDRLSTGDIIKLIHDEDLYAYDAVGKALPEIERAVEEIVSAFQQGGRLIYAGAGTSGRLGVLDASECPPTFGVERDMVQGIIAGGWDALRRSIEYAEDLPEGGAQEIIRLETTSHDVVCGIAASSTTPFVIGALQEARQRGAKTVFITCNPNFDPNTADIIIPLIVGPELITGSTRMKSGTATKMALNMLTTTAMIRIGKVFQNLMIDLTTTCNKLQQRARRILLTLTPLNDEQADTLLEQAQGRVKTALVMYFSQADREEAEQMIRKHQGRIQDIIPTNSKSCLPDFEMR